MNKTFHYQIIALDDALEGVSNSPLGSREMGRWKQANFQALLEKGYRWIRTEKASNGRDYAVFEKETSE